MLVHKIYESLLRLFPSLAGELPAGRLHFDSEKLPYFLSYHVGGYLYGTNADQVAGFQAFVHFAGFVGESKTDERTVFEVPGADIVTK